MKTNRRTFISTSVAAGFGAALPGLSPKKEDIKEKYAALDEILHKPVLKKDWFHEPVFIDTLELLRYKNTFLCRVRSKDGATGISVANNDQMVSLYPIFVKRLQPFFIGKDARDLEKIIDEAYVYQSNYKMQSLALWVPLVRKTFGDKMIIYADSNGSYTAGEAIRIGRIMEEYHYAFYEEPVPFDWYEETRQVRDALKIPIAGGEQEASMHAFRWLIANDALQVVQPDMFYFGGMVRSVKVARMAETFGKKCTPHISGSGIGYLYMMHFASSIPNAGPYHEFKGFNEELPFICSTSTLSSDDGIVTVPSGPGLGIEIDPDYIAKHQAVKG